MHCFRIHYNIYLHGVQTQKTMRVIRSVELLKEHLNNANPVLLGFVPTMGALHMGHISLVEKSRSECDITIVSIFVNPTQFNNKEDLIKYPRNLESDLLLLNDCLSDKDIVFTPEFEDLYSRESNFDIDLGGLESVMEGLHRPGHFEGVIRVVKLLFEAVNPHKAYFGQKDFQQLTIVRRMVKQLGMSIEIVSCPILRESNGLAMSSRNERLSKDIRSKASIIYSSLNRYSVVDRALNIKDIEASVTNSINSVEGFSIEYFEIVDELSLRKLESLAEISPQLKYYGCIAVFADGIRLIDNVMFSFQILKG